MKSLYQLHLSLLKNLGEICSTDVVRDSETLARRCEDEGDSYLTITLPRFAKALEKGLEQGMWPSQTVNSTWVHRQGLPAFMRGFLTRVFDESGVLLSNPDTDCIWAVRQFCYLTYKIQRDCTPERVSAAYQSYIDTDRQLLGLPARIAPDRLQAFVRMSHRLFGDLFARLDSDIKYMRLIPKHGPGAVAERLSQKEKRQFTYWPERLEAVFPKWRYTTNSQEFWSLPVPITEELPVRVVTVPKTQSKPRIIAVEPAAVQYAQQGLKRVIYDQIGRGPLSKVLGFSDQTRNRVMAREASLSRRFATLDLSEASDRVHWWIVFKMTEAFPHLWDFLWATRTRMADVDGRGVIPLQKYASMGSALTFPLEAMVFLCLAACGIEQTDHTRLTPHSMRGRISVYGDDIIVPNHTVDAVSDWLEHFGAVVNRSKTFSKGNFRESCGAEYYAGIDVSTVRVSSELPSSRRDAAELAALIDFRNRAFMHGLWSFVADLDVFIMKIMPNLPHFSASQVESGAPFIGFATFNPVTSNRRRFSSTLHREEIWVPRLKGHGSVYSIDGEPGLLEWFHSALTRDDPVDRYASQERAMSFSIRHGWTSEAFSLGVSAP